MGDSKPIVCFDLDLFKGAQHNKMIDFRGFLEMGSTVWKSFYKNEEKGGIC